MKTGPPRGTRDFYPDDMRLRNWLFGLWREVSERFGFEEYDGPPFESEELYTRKSGDEIVGQLYSFEDKGGRRIALRPEMTPTLARMIIARGPELPKPIKWFSIPQCFRYERMSRGRRREHYQWNLDIVGAEDVSAEAEIIAAAHDFLEKAGFLRGKFVIHISSRRLLGEILASEGMDGEKFADVCLVIDKKGKESDDTLRGMLETAGVSGELAERVFEVLNIESLDDAERRLIGAGRGAGTVDEVRRVFDYLAAYGIADSARFDISVVRGLAYYTGIVFEIFDAEKKYRAIAGGGRYDNLLESLGGGKVTAVGLGLGDVVISEILAARGLLPELERRIDYVVIPFSDAERKTAIEIACRLRSGGYATELGIGIKKLKKALADADRMGALKAVIVAPDELKENQVTVKDMATGEQVRVALDRIAET